MTMKVNGDVEDTGEEDMRGNVTIRTWAIRRGGFPMFHILISSWLLDHPKTSHIVFGDGENELRTYCAPSHTAPRSMRMRNESKLVFIFSDHPSGGVYYSTYGFYALARMPRVSSRTYIQRIIMMWHNGVDDTTLRPSCSKVRLCLVQFSRNADD